MEKRNWLVASKRSSVNRQIQLIERYCTGFDTGASFYRILVSSKLLSPVSAVSCIWQAKMDEVSPNFANFLCLVNSRSIIEKKAGDTKNGTFLQVALNTALDIDCFLFPDGQIPRN